MTSAGHIREATENDAASLVDLVDQLGYPASADEILSRLRQIDEYPQAQVWVAEDGGALVGLASGHMFPSVHASAPVAWLTSLVVSQSHYGRGIGRALVATAEAWARARGAVRLSLSSGTQRDDAHAFYERIGYLRTGVRLTKTLVLAVATVLASCQKSSTADSVSTRARVGASGIPSVDSIPMLDFSPPDGPALFSTEVGRAVRLHHGFVVADWGAGTLSKFDTLGNFLGQIGRRGSGPGEFESPNIVQSIDPDTVLVWDVALRRLSWVNIESGNVRSLQITAAAAQGGSPILGQVNGKILVRHTRVLPVQPGEASRQETEIRTLNEDGTQGAVVATIPFGDFPTQGLQLYPPRLYVHLGHDAIHWAHTDRWRVQRLAMNGAPLDSFDRSDWHAAEVSDEDKRIVRAEFERRRIDKSLTTDEHFAKLRPAFGPLISSTDGSLWLSGMAAPYRTADSLYFVDPATASAVALRMPARFRPTQIHRDQIIGIGLDDDDAARVQVYRVRWVKP